MKGEVRLKSFCADPAAIADYTPLYSKDGRRFATVVLTGAASNALTARIDGVATKEEADALKGTELYADRDQLPSLPDDEFYHADLIGLRVETVDGSVLGTVHALHDFGAGDLVEIRLAGGPRTELLRFDRETVPVVDIAAGRIVVVPPAGLFDLPPEDGADGEAEP